MFANILGYGVIGYMPHTKFHSSLMLGLFTCHEKWGDLWSNALCILYLHDSAGVSAAQYHFFVLINVNKTWSNHVLHASFVLFVISIDPLGISTSF